MKKILPLLPLLIAVSITYVTQKVIPNTEPKPATTEQIAYEFALSITDYTKQVRSMTDAPLPDALPPQDYLLLTKKDAFSAYKALADNDSKNLIAQCAVGYCYLLGIGTQKDEAAARAYYDRAGDFAPALNTLATMTDDREAAFALYKRAADQHYVTALYNLATAYRLGSGCQKDVQKAEACLQRICDLHLDDANGKGALALAQFHNDVYGERDALPYYVSAAEQGNSSAMFELWFRFFSRYRNQNDSYAAARAHWKRADFTLRAQQKEKRYKSALEKLPFLQQRAESGDAEAMVALANYYSGFESEQRNQLEEFEWRKRAADAGDADACFAVASCYARGKTAVQDLDQAIAYYERGLTLGGSAPAYSSSNRDLKAIVFCTLAVHSFINRYKAQQETYPITYSYGYYEDFSSFNQTTAYQFCVRHADEDEEYKLAIAYAMLLGHGTEQKSDDDVSTYLRDNDLATAISLLPITADDFNSEQSKAARARYKQEKAAERASYEEAASNGDAAALYALSELYNQRDDAESKRTAFELLQKASDAGSSEANYQLGHFYKTGLVGDSDSFQAARYYYKGAQAQNTACLTALAELYESGILITNASDAAAHAEDIGVPSEALATLTDGSVLQDIDTAIALYTLAAERGHYYAASALKDYGISLSATEAAPAAAASFDWESWTFGDYDFTEPAYEPPAYEEDDGYWENTQSYRFTNKATLSADLTATLEKLYNARNATDKAYRLIIAPEAPLTESDFAALNHIFTAIEAASALTLDVDLRQCVLSAELTNTLPAGALSGTFRNLYLPDSVTALANDSLDVHAKKIVFGSQLTAFNKPFAYSLAKIDVLDFSLLPESSFDVALVRAISALHENLYYDITIVAPFEFIYIDERHTLSMMQALKATLEANKDKKFVVDFTNSAYAIDSATSNWVPFPKNFLAKQDNLYFLLLGDCMYVDLPENICRGCTNLQAVLMWKTGNAGANAFRAVPKQCVIVDNRGNETPLRKKFPQ